MYIELKAVKARKIHDLKVKIPPSPPTYKLMILLVFILP
jgi:hypothetical protein